MPAAASRGWPSIPRGLSSPRGRRLLQNIVETGAELPRPGLPARGESLAAFDGRCIPAGCVAPRSNTPGILGRRALLAGRLARLGATPDFHHGLLTRGLIAGMSRIIGLAFALFIASAFDGSTVAAQTA